MPAGRRHAVTVGFVATVPVSMVPVSMVPVSVVPKSVVRMPRPGHPTSCPPVPLLEPA